MPVDLRCDAHTPELKGLWATGRTRESPSAALRHKLVADSLKGPTYPRFLSLRIKSRREQGVRRGCLLFFEYGGSEIADAVQPRAGRHCAGVRMSGASQVSVSAQSIR
jgi:hypothetical protein